MSPVRGGALIYGPSAASKEERFGVIAYYELLLWSQLLWEFILETAVSSAENCFQ